MQPGRKGAGSNESGSNEQGGNESGSNGSGSNDRNRHPASCQHQVFIMTASCQHLQVCASSIFDAVNFLTQFGALYPSASEHFLSRRNSFYCWGTLHECFRASCTTMTTEPLHHLTEQSAGVGTWMVKVAMEPCDLTYSWTKASRTYQGRKLEFVLVSDDATKCPTRQGA